MIQKDRPIGLAPSWQLAVKRLMDVILAAGGLVVLAPLLLIIATAIKLDSPGPMLYRWPVVGQGGRRIRAFKFRTMIIAADRLKPQLWDRNEATGPVFKMRNDPRVTRVGRILRRYSLDEIPQLWSVLRGDVSLVGPRPVLKDEWETFEDWQRRKLSVKPGMICLWHIRGQPRMFDEWVRLDLEYIENWSLWLDVTILLRGFGYVLRGMNY